MATSEPSRLHRKLPWLAERSLKKDPPARYKSTLRKAKMNGPLNAVGAVFNVIVGNVVVLVLIVPIVFHALHQWWHMTKHPQAFYDKDAATRALVADYQTQLAAGTWSGIGPIPLRLLVAPLAGLQLGLLVGYVAHLDAGAFIGAGIAATVAAYAVALATVKVGFRMAPVTLAL